MKGWRRLIGTGISSIYGLRRSLKLNNSTGFRVLMYHAVGSTVPNDSRGLFSISPNRFKEHMKILSSQYSDCLVSLASLPDTGVAVTFDDGYLDNLRIAAPIMVSMNIPFTVFVTPGFVQSGNPIYLSVAELRELAAVSGATIGAHGWTHKRLTECSDNDLGIELNNSRKWLEDVLGQPVTTMAYPHGAMNARVRRAASQAGFVIAASCEEGTSSTETDRLALARTAIFAQDDISAFRAKMNGDWDWLSSPVIENMQSLKKLIF